MAGQQIATSSGASSSTSRSRTGIVPGMMSIYNQQLKLSENNYQNLTSVYNQGQQTLANNLNRVYGGFSGLTNNVMHMLGVDGGGWGIATPAAQQIEKRSANTFGQNQQALLNAGLGNSSLLAMMRTANSQSTDEAMGALGSNLAQTAAGYESQLGLANLGAQMQGAGMQSNLTQSYMGDLSHYQFHDTNVLGNFSKSSSRSQQQSQSQGQETNNPTGGAGPGPMPGMQTSTAPQYGDLAGMYSFDGGAGPSSGNFGGGSQGNSKAPSWLSGGNNSFITIPNGSESLLSGYMGETGAGSNNYG